VRGAGSLRRDYVTGQKLRVEAYRRLTRVRKLDRLEEFRAELRDRFGPIPEPAEWLLRLQELRIRAASWKIADVHLEEPGEGTTDPWYLVLGYRNERKIKALKLRDPMVRIVDEKSAYYRLGRAGREPEELYATIRMLLA